MKGFEATKINDHVYWVGAVNWVGRDFHGYSTPRGTTYNAFLIMADKITLIDTVKWEFRDEMMARIATVIDPEKIDYVVSLHSEMDHSGALVETLNRIKPEKVFASKMGVLALGRHFKLPQEITAVEDGETLDLGGAVLTFLETRMLHWPDSMIAYLAEDKLLFSQDGFGMHLASASRFADELDHVIMSWEQAKYFGNILLPYSALITKLLDRVASLGIEIEMIAPDHGPIFRTPADIEKVLGDYARWALQKPTTKALVIYDTMWESTGTMARAVTEGIAAGGAHPLLLNVRDDHRSRVAGELLDAGALLIGSPTINNGIFPTLGDTLTYLKGLKPRNLIGAAFGSYGWSGEAVKILNKWLDDAKIERIGDGIKTIYVPEDDILEQCHDLGELVARKLIERCEAAD